MKIQLISDLHIEFWKSAKDYEAFDYTDADVLVVAGDLHVGRTNVTQTLNKYAKHYPYVVYVAGNHEFYNRLPLTDFNLPNLADNVFHLENDYVHIRGVTFTGSSLFTNFGEDYWAEHAARGCIADFKRIPDATIDSYKSRFYAAKDHFKWIYEQHDGPHVFVTHWLPAMECVHPRWKQDPRTNILNKYFANDLGSWIETLDNVTWLFGHTHDSVDMKLGNTRLVCNPHGYLGSADKNVDFNRSLIIEL